MANCTTGATLLLLGGYMPTPPPPAIAARAALAPASLLLLGGSMPPPIRPRMRAGSIQLRRSSVPGAVPESVVLLDGEPALNTADGLLYFRMASGDVNALGTPRVATAVAVGGVVALNGRAADWWQATLTLPTTAIGLVDARPGQTLYLRLAQDSAGGRAVTWPTGVRWAGGSPPAPTSAPGAVDAYELLCLAPGVFDAYRRGGDVR